MGRTVGDINSSSFQLWRNSLYPRCRKSRPSEMKKEIIEENENLCFVNNHYHKMFT